MATNKHLYNPVPVYRKFVDNQVLTDDQLNGVVDHLNYQDQLSRVLLSGAGIVCGLKASTASDGGVRLTGGVAVTTDGNLLKVEETLYEGFKPFGDENVKYPRFMQDEETTFPLWELETDPSPSDVLPMGDFEDEAGFSLDEATAILYLDDYLKEQEDCSPVDCDTQGREVINKIRLLLVSPENIEAIAQNDTIFAGLLQQGEEPLMQALPQMYASRVVLNPVNTAGYELFKKAYSVSFTELADRITELGSITLFEDSFDELDVDPARALRSFSRSFRNMQYLYDFYKDLVTAYNELRDLLNSNYAICCPDPNAFAKHLMLGGIGPSENPWRHGFYESPILDQTNGLERMKAAYSRLLLMIKDFKTEPKEGIRITPSRTDSAPLGRRAVPFYYDLEDSDDPALFMDSWKEGKAELVPNYYGYDYEVDPLDVCLDGHDFYRVEGHVGRGIMDAHKAIQTLQKDKGLAFDIMPIAIGRSPDEVTIDYDKYRVYFEDLQVVLQAWNEEQQCLIKDSSKFLTGFNTDEEGAHADYKILGQPVERAENTERTERVERAGPFGTSGLNIMAGSAQPLFFSRGTGGSKKNVVLEGIATEENTIGNIISGAIKGSDNRNDIQVKANAAVIEIVQDWNDEVREAAFEIPTRIIGFLKETEDNKLTNIEDFTEENLEKYITSLEAQCKQTRSSKKRFQGLNNLKANERAQPWIEHYEFTLNRIIASCCLVEKVKVLYEKILERKQEVLQQLVLDNFISRHPGAEHKAGVPNGGTFILVYLSKNTEQREGFEEQSEAELVSSGRESVAQPVFGRAVRGLSSGFSSQPIGIREDIIEAGIRSRIGRFSEVDLSGVLSASRFRLSENIPHGTVIGDLCLPYVCCSASPPTQFVFPEQLATLRLPVDHICMDEEADADLVLMDIQPAGGEVHAFVGERELSGVIVQQDTGTFFDPNPVPTNNYGAVIRFEVNSQPVEPILQLYSNPQPGFTFSDPDEIRFRNNNTAAVVTFENTSEPFEELSFRWDLAGEVFENQNALRFTHTFEVDPGENFDFEVTLTASNGPCEETLTQSVNIDVPPLEGEEPVEDEPDEDDDNNEPDNSCEQLTARSIQASLDVMQNEMDANRERLGGEIREFYDEELRPRYEGILENPEGAFAGAMDDDLFPFIQNTHFDIPEGLGNQELLIQREFVLKVYFELILLYFYLQACRDDEIRVDERISDVAGDWVRFTETAAGQFPEALAALLEEDIIHEKLEAIREQLQERFDDEIGDIVDDIIQILNEFLDQ